MGLNYRQLLKQAAVNKAKAAKPQPKAKQKAKKEDKK